jgi:DNA-binding protein H-NS
MINFAVTLTTTLQTYLPRLHCVQGFLRSLQTFHKCNRIFPSEIRCGGSKVNLKSMPIGKLSKLKEQVDAILRTKVADQRRSLEAELTKLSRFSTSQLRSKGPGIRGPVAPKYRNPDNPSETWAGRGLKPRWLAAALKGGKKLEHFSIAQTAKQATKRAPRKVSRAKRR